MNKCLIILIPAITIYLILFNVVIEKENSSTVVANSSSLTSTLLQPSSPAVISHVHQGLVNSSDLPPKIRDLYSYSCVWTSGTYSETGTWDWEDMDLTFSVDFNGDLEVEFITALCDYPSYIPLTTAYAVYFPATESNPLHYDLFADISWGYLPQWPPGWCWMLMVDQTWSGLPHSHGISVTVDWASAYVIGWGIPPIDGICGWPLVESVPPPFTVNGI